MTEQVASPALTFPKTFCCNCGSLDCLEEVQETRVSRFFGLHRSETVFRLALPVCALCRRSTRRVPAGFFSRLLALTISLAAWSLAIYLLGLSVVLPAWVVAWRVTIVLVLAIVSVFVFYRFRRPRPPQTSFYQPVRIKQADVRIGDVMGGAGQVAFLKLAFTNPEYLNAFREANLEAVQAGHLAVVRA